MAHDPIRDALEAAEALNHAITSLARLKAITDDTGLFPFRTAPRVVFPNERFVYLDAATALQDAVARALPKMLGHFREYHDGASAASVRWWVETFDPMADLNSWRDLQRRLMGLAGSLHAMGESSQPRPAVASGDKPPVLPIVLGGPADDPIVRGRKKDRLSVARFNVVKTLMDAGEAGLTGDDLATKSGHGGAVNVLKTLARSDPDWESVILLAGGPGNRYRVRLTEVDGD